MARNGEGASGNHRDRSWLSFLNLMFLIGSTLFWDPQLTLAQRNPHKPSILLPIYAYIYLLNPINFFLNILLLYLDYATTDASNPEGSPPVFWQKYLSPAAHIVSVATLVLSAPLSVLAAVSEESAGLAIAAGSVCLSLITVLSSVVWKLLKSAGIKPVLFTLCIVTGFLLSFGSFFAPFPDKISGDIPVSFILVRDLLLPFIGLVAFTLSMILVILRIAASASTRAGNFTIAALSVAIAALLVGEYLQLYVTVTDMAAVLGNI